ncbi:MAG: ATP synthase subunit I [Candidatus Latescibacteria bacterium]|nr:ATP synthase subunit I [Candidatus Latescibacterota bacterium]
MVGPLLAKDTRFLEIDEGFLGRVYRMSGAVGIFVVLLLWSYGYTHALLSFTIGAGISLAFLRGTEYIIRHYLVPGERKVRKTILIAFTIKLLLLGAGLYVFVRTDWLNVIALAAGLGLAQAVMGLKALGIALVNVVNRV